MYTTTDVIIDEITGEETLKDKLIMVFPRNKSKELYILWKRRELKWKNLRKKKLKNML